MFDLVDKWWSDIRKAVWEDNKAEMARNKPPEDAIPILKPDGNPYMWLWYQEDSQRVCMMFANRPGYTIKWTSLTIPDMISALVTLMVDGAVVKQAAQSQEEPLEEPEEPQDA